MFSIRPYLDPTFWNYFCLVKDKFPNPCSQKLVRIPSPWTEQSLAARNSSKSPPFSDTLTGFILLTVHPAFNPITSHSLDFKDLQHTHLILPLWSHVNLVPQRLILLLSFVLLLCLIHPSGGLLFHSCGSISSGLFPCYWITSSTTNTFKKLGYVRTTGEKMLYDSISARKLLMSYSARAPFRNHVNETTQLHKAVFLRN